MNRTPAAMLLFLHDRQHQLRPAAPAAPASLGPHLNAYHAQPEPPIVCGDRAPAGCAGRAQGGTEELEDRTECQGRSSHRRYGSKAPSAAALPGGSQVRKKANQTTPRISIASPVEMVRRANTDGPG